jgi:hypothetical protein
MHRRRGLKRLHMGDENHQSSSSSLEFFFHFLLDLPVEASANPLLLMLESQKQSKQDSCQKKMNSLIWRLVYRLFTQDFSTTYRKRKNTQPPSSNKHQTKNNNHPPVNYLSTTHLPKRLFVNLSKHQGVHLFFDLFLRCLNRFLDDLPSYLGSVRHTAFIFAVYIFERIPVNTLTHYKMSLPNAVFFD